MFSQERYPVQKESGITEGLAAIDENWARLNSTWPFSKKILALAAASLEDVLFGLASFGTEADIVRLTSAFMDSALPDQMSWLLLQAGRDSLVEERLGGFEDLCGIFKQGNIPLGLDADSTCMALTK